MNHKIIDQPQYSYLVATVIGSAVIPTVVANAFFMPRHLLPAASTTNGTAASEPAQSEGTALEAPQNTKLGG